MVNVVITIAIIDKINLINFSTLSALLLFMLSFNWKMLRSSRIAIVNNKNITINIAPMPLVAVVSRSSS